MYPSNHCSRHSCYIQCDLQRIFARKVEEPLMKSVRFLITILLVLALAVSAVVVPAGAQDQRPDELVPLIPTETLLEGTETFGRSVSVSTDGDAVAIKNDWADLFVVDTATGVVNDIPNRDRLGPIALSGDASRLFVGVILSGPVVEHRVDVIELPSLTRAPLDSIVFDGATSIDVDRTGSLVVVARGEELIAVDVDNDTTTMLTTTGPIENADIFVKVKLNDDASLAAAITNNGHLLTIAVASGEITNHGQLIRLVDTQFGRAAATSLAISAEGFFVAFAGHQSLVRLDLRDGTSVNLDSVTLGPAFGSGISMSPDGSLIGFSSTSNFSEFDSNASWDGHMWKPDTGEIRLVTTFPSTSPPLPQVSGVGEIILTPNSPNEVLTTSVSFGRDSRQWTLVRATPVEKQRHLRCNGRAVTVAFGLGDTPTSGDDVILGTDGAEVIDGGAGDDVICAALGDDTVLGGAGDDLLLGNYEPDRLFGGPGNDVLHGGEGQDLLVGGDGEDRIFAGTGDDALRGGPGDDELWGGGGMDQLFGGTGDDTLRGGGDADLLEGRRGTDSLHGGSGDDELVGGRGVDVLRGGPGVDVCDPHKRERARSCTVSS